MQHLYHFLNEPLTRPGHFELTSPLHAHAHICLELHRYMLWKVLKFQTEHCLPSPCKHHAPNGGRWCHAPCTARRVTTNCHTCSDRAVAARISREAPGSMERMTNCGHNSKHTSLFFFPLLRHTASPCVVLPVIRLPISWCSAASNIFTTDNNDPIWKVLAVGTPPPFLLHPNGARKKPQRTNWNVPCKLKDVCCCIIMT